MRNLKKLIAITVMTALLLCAAMTAASADEQIYTSPVFQLPMDQLTEWLETLPEETEEPEDEEDLLDDPEEEEEVPVDPEEAPEDPDEVPEDPDEAPEDPDEVPEDPDEVPEDPEDPETAPEEEEQEPEKPKREVRLYSSQGDVVTEGEIITLSSELIGFDGLKVAYQWQVDKGDGAGWVDVEGATKAKHKFVASRETIQYSWRLIVNIIE